MAAIFRHRDSRSLKLMLNNIKMHGAARIIRTPIPVTDEAAILPDAKSMINPTTEESKDA